MEPWILPIILVVGGVLFYVAQHFGWIDLSNKSTTSGPSGGAMGMGDEVFNASRYEAQIELDRQTVLPAPAPVAGDGDKGIYDGQVKIDLTDPDGRGSRRDPGTPRAPDGRAPE